MLLKARNTEAGYSLAIVNSENIISYTKTGKYGVLTTTLTGSFWIEKEQLLRVHSEEEVNFLYEVLEGNETKGLKEPESLEEICKVGMYGPNIIYLEVEEEYVPLARKFGLSDMYSRYEFDGYTMSCFKPGTKSSSFSFSCGAGGHTLVADSVEKYTRNVKIHMGKKAKEQGLCVPEVIRRYI